jgi:hypothetical protein
VRNWYISTHESLFEAEKFVITSIDALYLKITTMSDEQPSKHSSKRKEDDGVDGRPPVESVRLSACSSPLSELTRTPASRRKNEATNDRPRTPTSGSRMSTDDLIDRYSDPAVAEDAYDQACYAENGGAADSDEEGDGLYDVLPTEATMRFQDEIDGLEREEVYAPEAVSSNAAPELPGAPPGWKIPQAPENWEPANAKGKGVPAFATVDNPGGWSEYTFQPKYKKAEKGKGMVYLRHALPTGATPVPEVKGKREVAGWKFHYDGSWTNKSKKQFRSGATKVNPFPDSRNGCLDAKVLAKLGMSKERMCEADGAPDALFFHQLILPIIDPVNSGIKDDPRKAFYSKASQYTNLYAIGELQLGNGIGHKWVNTDGPELLRWDGVNLRDGVLGGSNGAILRRFHTRKDNAQFSKEIYDSMTKTRWLEIKRCIKLCNNLTAKKQGEQGYDPAYKFDMIYDVMVHNVNALTKHACLDLCGDETTWGHQGFAEKGCGLTGLVQGKPGITKGGQIVMLWDVNWLRPRAYVHRHKKHEKHFNVQGQNEVFLIWQKIDKLLVQQENQGNGSSRSEVFREKPHLTFDNFFSGDNTLNFACDNGFGITMTCRRDRLPKGIPDKYLQKEKTGTGAISKAARFQQPIFATMTHKDSGSTVQLCSFQSTSSCNIISVNAVNSCSLFAQTKSRGQLSKQAKRQWAIEMNEQRQLYLRSYFVMDNVDHMIQNCNLQYRTWKYWHSPMLHAKGMIYVITYDMYLECATGNLNHDWKLGAKQIVDFYRWREKLSAQMLGYSPKQRKYPGDEKFRVSTSQPKSQRSPFNSPVSTAPRVPRSAASVATSATSGVTSDDVKKADKRLCGNLCQLLQHVDSVAPLPNGSKRVCSVCGVKCGYMCGKCKVPLHYYDYNPKEKGAETVHCFLQYHNTNYYGLAKKDRTLVGVKHKDFTLPDIIRMNEHSIAMQRLRVQDISSPLATHATANTPHSHNDKKRKRTRCLPTGTSVVFGEDAHDDNWNERCL